MRTGNIIEATVAQVLEASGDARSGMIFQRRDIDDLREFPCDDARHIGASLPFAEEVSFAEDLRIVPGKVRESVLDAENLNAGGKQHLVAAYVDLVSVTIVDNDVSRGNFYR